jgi:hypothetical protein
VIDTRGTAPIAFHGACHCGAVKFAVELPYGLASARRCTCSLCRMRGAVAVTAKASGLTLTAGEEVVGTYRFNTMTAEHHFCTLCGIYTHHKRRSNPDEFGVNVACLEGVSPFDFAEVVVNDGERHPSDDPQNRSHIAGVLRFEAAPKS